MTNQQPDHAPSLISFDGGQFGDITIGDVVGGDLTRVSVHQTVVTAEAAYDVAGLPNPFLQLRAFTYADRSRYAGREAQVGETVSLLTAPGEQRTLLFVMGASGSGKSSFAQAGLVPALEDHYRGRARAFRHATFRPGGSPLAALADALLTVGLRAEGPFAAARPFMQDEPPEPAQPGQVTALVIDQFEELFTRADPGQRDALFALLHALPAFAELRVHLIATLRSDFLPELFERPSLYDIAKRGVDLRAMGAEELELAIQRPIQQTNPDKRFEPALVERLAQDASGDAAYLPLLQTSLFEIWRRGSLTLASYGDFAQAIGQRADAIFTYSDYDGARRQQRSAEDQAAILRIFLDLVEVSLDDNTRRDIRRRRSLSDLTRDDERLRALVDDLARARLLTTSVQEGTEVQVVDIVHESLIARWDRLQEHIASERATLQRRARFEHACGEWLAQSRDRRYLLEGGRLADAEQLAREGDIATQSPEAREFLRRSRARRDRELRIAWLAVVVLGLLAIAASIGGVAAYSGQRVADEQRRAAERQALLSRAQAIAGQSQAQLDYDPELGLLLAMEAISTTQQVGLPPLPEAEQALHAALIRSQIRAVIEAPHPTGTEEEAFAAAATLALAVSPDGRTFASSGADGQIKIWDLTTRELVRTFGRHAESLVDVRYAPDGRSILATGDGATISRWDAASGDVLFLNPLGGGGSDLFQQAAFSPDGRSFVVVRKREQSDLEGGTKGNIALWSLEPMQEIRSFAGHELRSEVFGVAFHPDGQRIATVGGDNQVILWDVASGKQLLVLKGHTDRVIGVDFSPDGTLLATGSWDKTVRLWDVASGRELRVLSGHTDRVRRVAFSPDGARLVSVGWDGRPRVWDVRTGESLVVFQGHQSRVHRAVFHPDGRRVASVDEGGKLIIWDAGSGETIRTITSGDDELTGVGFSPDGARIVTGGNTGIVKVWDAETGELVRELEPRGTNVPALAYNSDGTRLVSGGFDSTAKVWDVGTGRLLRTFREHTGAVISVEYRPGSDQIVSSDDTSGLLIWSERTGEVSYRAEPYTTEPDDTFAPVGRREPHFSPDGRLIVSSGTMEPSDTKRWSFDDSAVTIWDVESGEVLHTLSAPDGARANGQHFSPDGKQVVTAHQGGDAYVWDAVDGTLLHALPQRGPSNGWDALYSPDGTSVAVLDMAGAVRLWDSGSGELLRTLAGKDLILYATVFSNDGSTLLTAGMSGDIRFWNARAGAELPMFDGTGHPHGGYYQNEYLNFNLELLAYSPDNSRLIAVYNRHAAIFDTASWQILHELPELSIYGVSGVRWSPNGKTVMTYDGNATVALYDAETFEETHAISGTLGVYCPDGKTIMVAVYDELRGFQLWDSESGKLLRTFDGRGISGSGLMGLACAPDGRSFATGSGDVNTSTYQIALWDIDADKPVRVITDTMQPSRLRFSPDGKRVLSNALMNTSGTGAKVWDVATGQHLFSIGNTAHGSASYSPDGRRIVTTDIWATLWIWDAETGALLLTIRDSQPGFDFAEFSPDGTRLATFSTWPLTIRQYILPVDELTELARTRVTRELTPAEWEQFLSGAGAGAGPSQAASVP